MARTRILSDDQLARMLAWRRKNKSFNFIGQRLGCSISTVRYQCLVAGVVPEGVTPKPSKFPMTFSRNGVLLRRFTDEEDAIVLSMLSAGSGPVEIGRALGRSSGTISNRILALRCRRQIEAAAFPFGAITAQSAGAAP